MQIDTFLRYNRAMKRERILLLLGVWVAVLPYLGFPHSWKNVLFTLSGLGLIYLSYILHRESKMKEGAKEVFDNFSENKFERDEGEERNETING